MLLATHHASEMHFELVLPELHRIVGDKVAPARALPRLVISLALHWGAGKEASGAIPVFRVSLSNVENEAIPISGREVVAPGTSPALLDRFESRKDASLRQEDFMVCLKELDKTLLLHYE